MKTNIYDTIRKRTKPETKLKVQDEINQVQIDMLDPTKKEAWNNLMELCEYYQDRCHSAERLLMDVTDPFKFYWFGQRWNAVRTHINMWAGKIPKIFQK